MVAHRGHELHIFNVVTAAVQTACLTFLSHGFFSMVLAAALQVQTFRLSAAYVHSAFSPFFFFPVPLFFLSLHGTLSTSILAFAAHCSGDAPGMRIRRSRAIALDSGVM